MPFRGRWLWVVALVVRVTVLACRHAFGARWAIVGEVLLIQSLPARVRVQIYFGPRSLAFPRVVAISDVWFPRAPSRPFVDALPTSALLRSPVTFSIGPFVSFCAPGVVPYFLLGTLRCLHRHCLCGVLGARVQEMIRRVTTNTKIACAAFVEESAVYFLLVQPVGEGADVLKSIYTTFDVFRLLDRCFDGDIACEF